MSRADSRPLWALCTINDETLSETTPGDFSFEYVDISNVTQGRISDELERYSFRDAPLRARRLAKAGDVIVSTVRTYLRAIAQVEDQEARVYSTGFAVLRPRTDAVNPRFLAYTLTSNQVMDEIVATSAGVSYPAISGTALHRIRVPYHHLDEQHAIADYLDHETGEIDEMIGKLNRLVEKLEEHRRAVFTSILAELFDGAKIPLWNVLTPIKDQNHPNEEILSVYRDYGVIPKSSRDDNHNRTPADVSSYQLVRPADVVINKMKAWQGSLGISDYRGIVSPDYQVARPICEVVPAYLHAVLRSPIMVPHYRVRSRGVRPAQWRLYWEDFANLQIPLPPIDEQHRIADHLGEVTQKIHAMLGKVAKLKELLIERRAALITDVVTGKKEVA